MVQEDIAVPEGSLLIRASSFKLYQLNLLPVRDLFDKAPIEKLGQNDWSNSITIEVPMPDGHIMPFEMMLRHTMHPDLMVKYPLISNGIIRSKSDHNITGVVDVTYQGFHAMISSVRFGTVFIDPYIHLNSLYYIVYRKADFITDKVFQCSFENQELPDEYPHGEYLKGRVSDNILRTYRTAIAATGEYTIFQGGTVALALSAINTSNNRVSGVMTKDFAIVLQIISNNNLIVYTDTLDPYTNNNGSAMLGQNQTNLTSVIGSANYDFGHVYSTNGGGVANLGCVCRNNQKAKGVTGTSLPVGDPFDIDYVAHEMGHQLAENHTFNNSCSANRTDSTAFEPGSGTTIMGYAGICPPDIQNHSDAYFHAKSLAETATFITGGFGNNCGTQTVMSNGAPVVTIPGGNRTIPKSTPFELTASGTDPNGDPIYYCWEQMNNELATMPPVSTSTGGPNFRSLSPQLSQPTRSFPILASILNGTNTNTWEVLPSVGRTLNFRVTARDNVVTGGRTHEANMTVTVSNIAGPFQLTTPNTAGLILAGGSTQTFNWSVNSSNLAPVSCVQVDILMSIDGGQTFPYVVVVNTANDGTEDVVIPNFATTQARFKIKAEGNVFFDINDFNSTVLFDPLPVKLTVFEGRSTKNGNLLHWESASEVNFFQYELERSSDAVNFQVIDRIAPKGTSTAASYEFLDINSGQKAWYYRLRMVDQDGTDALSKIVFLASERSEIQVYPNPANDELYIQRGESQEALDFTVFNVYGQRMIDSVKSAGFGATSSKEPLKIKIDFLSPGFYWIDFYNSKQSPVIFQKR
ncbi:MAG: reprolysin-like metallopeptidase [Saprospiraceae bacterium]